MRIHHISSLYAPHFFGGAERVVQIIAEGAAARGMEVGVAHLTPKMESDGERNGVRVFPFAHRNPLWLQSYAHHTALMRQFNKVATIFNIMTTRDAANIIDKYKPDIVHTHSMVALSPWIWKVAGDRGIKIVHTLQDFDLVCLRSALFKDGKRCEKRHASCVMFSYMKKHYHSAIDHVVGASQSIIDIHRKYGMLQSISAQDQHVIWNPGQSKRERLRSVRPGHSGELSFGFLGRLVPEKGIEVLLDACRLLPASGWKLKIGGLAHDGDASLRARAAGLPVSFLGYVDSDGFFDEIDVLVAPVLWSEPFGMTVVEAFAAGIPVIGSDIGGIAEVIRSVEPAWLVPPGDSVALAQKMAEMLSAGQPVSDMLPNVAEVVKRTSHEFVIDRYLDVYRKC